MVVENADGVGRSTSPERSGIALVDAAVLFGLIPLLDATKTHSAPFLLQREHWGPPSQRRCFSRQLVQTGESFIRRPSIRTAGFRCWGSIDFQVMVCVVLDTIRRQYGPDQRRYIRTRVGFARG